MRTRRSFCHPNSLKSGRRWGILPRIASEQDGFAPGQRGPPEHHRPARGSDTAIPLHGVTVAALASSNAAFEADLPPLCASRTAPAGRGSSVNRPVCTNPPGLLDGALSLQAMAKPVELQDLASSLDPCPNRMPRSASSSQNRQRKARPGGTSPLAVSPQRLAVGRASTQQASSDCAMRSSSGPRHTPATIIAGGVSPSTLAGKPV